MAAASAFAIVIILAAPGDDPEDVTTELSEVAAAIGTGTSATIATSTTFTSTTTTTSSTSTSTTTTTSTTSTTTTTVPFVAERRLFSNLAVLRSAPDLSAPEITRLRNLDGEPLTVLEPQRDGWYHVRIGGLEGWIFGTFVLPTDPGQLVAQSDDTFPLRDSNGGLLAIENASGEKVLVVDSTRADLWRVRLPEHVDAWVHPDDAIAVFSA
jgi:hypothetical protein